MTTETSSSVLLVETIEDWREIQQEILTDLGFQVIVLPRQENPVDFAARIVPHVIVIHLGPDQPYNSDDVDRFQANPITRNIPIVAVTVSKSTVVQALAGANVGEAILAPFDIIALEAAVLSAVRHPPLAASLPWSPAPPVEAVAFASGELVNHIREIVLRAVERLRSIEPYRSREAGLSVGLVDRLGTMMGAIATGLQRGLDPGEVFAVPEVQYILDEHVRIRLSQGLGLAQMIRENHVLSDQVSEYVQGLIGQAGFRAEDAATVDRRLRTIMFELIRVLTGKFQRAMSPPPPARDGSEPSQPEGD